MLFVVPLLLKTSTFSTQDCAKTLIISALDCNGNAVKSLILLGADLSYRIKSKDDTVLNAYDFAERYTDKSNPECVKTIEYLKNPKSVSIENIDTEIKESAPAQDNNSSNENNTVIENQNTVQEQPKDPIDVEVNLE